MSCFCSGACYIVMKVPFFAFSMCYYASLHGDIFLVLRIKNMRKRRRLIFIRSIWSHDMEGAAAP